MWRGRLVWDCAQDGVPVAVLEDEWQALNWARRAPGRTAFWRAIKCR